MNGAAEVDECEMWSLQSLFRCVLGQPGFSDDQRLPVRPLTCRMCQSGVSEPP